MNGSIEIPLSKPIGFQKYKRALFLICFFSSLFGGTVSTLMSVYLPDAIKDLLPGWLNAKHGEYQCDHQLGFYFRMDGRWNYLGNFL